mgnify:FL=1
MLLIEVNNLSQPLASSQCASIKTYPEDWRVTEITDQSWSSEGEHAYIYVEKRGMNTAAVAAWLARCYQVKEMNVGFSGMKDKFAVTQQWFSVHSPLDLKSTDLALVDSSGSESAYAKALQITRHNKKLRRGEHTLNHFKITLRDLAFSQELSEDSLSALGTAFPNYFGPQRFGLNNIESALSWLKNRRNRKISRKARGWHFSVLRSLLFNKIAGARVAAGNVHEFIAGDAEEFSVPSGSLWGRGRSVLSADALAIETHALAEDAWVCEALEFAGVDRAMRPLSVLPQNFSCAMLEDAVVEFEFALPPGAYATVLLAQHFDIKDKSI